MSYSPLVPLISVTVLYEKNLKEQQAFEQEVVTRWLTILTREHIEEKIKVALKSGKQSAVLIDEQFDIAIDEKRMFREPVIPYQWSICQHIQSLLEDKDNVRIYCSKKDGCVLLCLGWGSHFDLNDEDEADACFRCALCCICLCCCMPGMFCHH